jgi:hypothetical protein
MNIGSNFGCLEENILSKYYSSFKFLLILYCLGPHRYVVAVYEQQAGRLEVAPPSGRPKFDMNKFADNNK